MARKKAQAQTDEVWTTKDGRKIAVGDMEEEHVRNVLRMILRNQRKITEARAQFFDHVLDTDLGDGQDFLAAQAHRDLDNPDAFFPLLDGGVHGSPELQRKYGGR